MALNVDSDFPYVNVEVANMTYFIKNRARIFSQFTVRYWNDRLKLLFYANESYHMQINLSKLRTDEYKDEDQKQCTVSKF